MLRPVLLALVLTLPVSVPRAAAQQAPSPEPPVSLAHIKRALQDSRRQDSLDQLRLAYYVSVIASEPQPGSQPSHQELFQQVTPQEFSAPVADFTAIAAWLGSKIAHKKSGS